jgi:hypothetical protein
MLYGIKTVASYVTGTDIAGRNFAVYPDDTMLVSYPRSGNTWTRFLVANLVFAGQTVDFTSIERLIPDTTLQSHQQLKRIARPRIIKSHEYFDHRYPRTIYIVRDPRDVVLSYYDYNRRNKFIGDNVPLETFVDWFVSGKLGSSSWGTWGENVGSWLYTRGGSSTFLLLHYADLRANPVEQMRRVAKFLGISPDPERLRSAIELSSAARMREMEVLQYDAWLKTQSYAARRAKRNRVRKEIPFVGEARSNAWRTILSESSIHQIETAWGEIMTNLGYELVTVPRTEIVPLATA